MIGESQPASLDGHVWITADGRWALAVVQGPGELAILNTAAGTVAAVVPVGKAPHWSTSSSDGRTAYVTNEATNDVSVVDLAGRRVLATIPVGNAPRKIAVQPGSTVAAASPATASAAPWCYPLESRRRPSPVAALAPVSVCASRLIR